MQFGGRSWNILKSDLLDKREAIEMWSSDIHVCDLYLDLDSDNYENS